MQAFEIGKQRNYQKRQPGDGDKKSNAAPEVPMILADQADRVLHAIERASADERHLGGSGGRGRASADVHESPSLRAFLIAVRPRSARERSGTAVGRSPALWQ